MKILSKNVSEESSAANIKPLKHEKKHFKFNYISSGHTLKVKKVHLFENDLKVAE